MSKRNLNRRQRWRINKIQEEKSKRLQKQESQISELSTDHQHYPGLVIAKHGKQLEVLNLSSQNQSSNSTEATYLCHIRANIPDMVVGDRVVWSKVIDSDANRGVIESLESRSSLLSRKDKNGQEKIIAANLDQVFVVVACEPETSFMVIDRYIAACTLLGLPLQILINKSDLDGFDDYFKKLQENYQHVVDDLFPCSINNKAQLERLKHKLENHNSVFIGQSGVGKSSLVKTLLGKHEIKTRSLSERSGLGQHTTSSSRLYVLEGDAFIIDSPGIRDFDLDEVDLRDLQRGYREIAAIDAPCKFRDCSHLNEPGCQVRSAVDDGRISEQRYQNYLLLAEQLCLLK